MRDHSPIILAAILLCACGDSSGPQPTPVVEYTLESIDGLPLPAYRTTPPAPGVDNYRSLYRSGSLTVGDSVTTVLDKSMEWPRDTWTDRLIRRWGVIESRGSPGQRFVMTISQVNNEPPTAILSHDAVLAWAGDSIVVSDEGGSMLYRRVAR